MWDVTVADTLASSYIGHTSLKAGAAAEAAASRKIIKYNDLSVTRLFCPLAFESLGPICEEGLAFFDEVGERLVAATGDPRERSFLYQRLSIAIQRCNAICAVSTFLPSAFH
jgi:hypothetical protein